MRKFCSLLSIAFLCASLPLLTACSQPQGDPVKHVPLYAQEQYVAGVVALHELRLADAETAARESLGQAPDYVEAQVLLAEALFKQGNADEAIATLDASIAASPSSPDPLVLRGMAHELAGELPKAQELYRRAQASYDTTRLTREQAAAYATVSYLALGRLAGFKALDEAQERFPGDHQLKVLRSQISQDQRAYFLQRAKAEAATETEDALPNADAEVETKTEEE